MITNGWFLGKDDFLFLGDRYQKTVSKLTGVALPSNEKLFSTFDSFEKITNVANKFNTKVIVFIGANKSSIYSDYLPENMSVSKNRYLNYFISTLEKNDDLIIYDSKNDLLEQRKKSNDFLYYRTDTHWNDKGAYIAYKGFLKKLGIPFALKNVFFKNADSKNGDLISISGQSVALHNDDNYQPILTVSSVKCTKTGIKVAAFNEIENFFNSKAPIDKVVRVVGDSFSVALRQYFSATFKYVNFIGHWSNKLPSLPNEILLSKIKPNIIVIVRVERSF